MTGTEEKKIEVVGFPQPFGPFPESRAGWHVRGQEVAFTPGPRLSHQRRCGKICRSRPRLKVLDELVRVILAGTWRVGSVRQQRGCRRR